MPPTRLGVGTLEDHPLQLDSGDRQGDAAHDEVEHEVQRHAGEAAGDHTEAGTEAWVELGRPEAVDGRHPVEGERPAVVDLGPELLAEPPRLALHRLADRGFGGSQNVADPT